MGEPVAGVTLPTLDALAEQGVVPVIRTPTLEAAERAVRLLRDAGFRVFEITMSVPRALDLIGRLAREDGLVVGAGTVWDASQALACIEAGAGFVVSPFLLPDLPEACHARGVACIVGALTPTEIRLAHLAGADAVKVFPAEAAGGPGYIRAVKSVAPHIPLVPTGGVTLENLTAYLDAGALFVGVGGALTGGPDADAAQRAARYLRGVTAARESAAARGAARSRGTGSA